MPINVQAFIVRITYYMYMLHVATKNNTQQNLELIEWERLNHHHSLATHCSSILYTTTHILG